LWGKLEGTVPTAQIHDTHLDNEYDRMQHVSSTILSKTSRPPEVAQIPRRTVNAVKERSCVLPAMKSADDATMNHPVKAVLTAGSSAQEQGARSGKLQLVRGRAARGCMKITSLSLKG
jgi:hypothetical protein